MISDIKTQIELGIIKYLEDVHHLSVEGSVTTAHRLMTDLIKPKLTAYSDKRLDKFIEYLDKGGITFDSDERYYTLREELEKFKEQNNER